MTWCWCRADRGRVRIIVSRHISAVSICPGRVPTSEPGRARRGADLVKQRVGRGARRARRRACAHRAPSRAPAGTSRCRGRLQRRPGPSATRSKRSRAAARPASIAKPLAPVVGVDDDTDLDRLGVDAAPLADGSHLDEGDRLTVEQRKPRSNPCSRQLHAPARRVLRHSLARQWFASACRCRPQARCGWRAACPGRPRRPGAAEAEQCAAGASPPRF